MKAEKKKKGTFREYAEALLTAVAVALFIRSFAVEAFKIPSGSMIPTLSIGDHIFVNKFIYGPRIPLTKFRILDIGAPSRGDVIVFMYPRDESKDYIKRVVGLPGDSVRVEGDGVWVNGVQVERRPIIVSGDPGDRRKLLVERGQGGTIPYAAGWEGLRFYEENLGEAAHIIQYEPHLARPAFEAVVPPGSYFVMGDNRDNSEDSRGWGFVPEGNIKGKAMFVWLSLDRDHDSGIGIGRLKIPGIRWREFGRWIR